MCRSGACGDGEDGEKSWDTSLRRIFNTVLDDCASLRNVLSADEEDGACSPKESFLCILVRNALCITRRDLVVDEEALVALPRHWSGELSPLFRYMSTRVCAPLLVSISADVPVDSPTLVPQDEYRSGGSVSTRRVGSGGHEDVRKSTTCSSHGNSEAAESPGPIEHPDSLPVYIVPERDLSVSEWLRRPVVKEIVYEQDTEDEEASEDQRCLSELNLHVLDCPRDRPLPVDAALPIVCMAEGDVLPVIMASALYQRHVWRVQEPLVGISFKRYDTSISFLLGWIEAAKGDDYLPNIDLANPECVLIVTQFFLHLHGCIANIQNNIALSRSVLAEELRGERLVRWRVDSATASEDEDCIGDPEDLVSVWLHGLEDSETLSKACLLSRLSDTLMSDICEYTMSFYWPQVWGSPDDIPPVDANVTYLLAEFKLLVESHQKAKRPTLDTLRERKSYMPQQNQESFKAEDVLCLFSEGSSESVLWKQVDKLLVGSLSTILNTCSLARGRVQAGISLNEASWRHDLDRIFFDFLATATSPVLQSDMDEQDNTKGQRKVHAILECMIALPRSVYGGYNLEDRGDRESIKQDARRFVNTVDDLFRADWKDLDENKETVERDIHRGLSVLWAQWRDTLTPDSIKERLAISPTQAKCDAVGLLRMPVCLNLDKKTFDSYKFIKSLSALNPSPSAALGTGDSLQPAKKKSNTTALPSKSSVINYITFNSAVRETSTPYRTSQETSQVSSEKSDRAGLEEQMSKLQMKHLPQKTARSGRRDKPEETSYLELPLILVEYKRPTTSYEQGQNQRRLYCTSAARFLEAIGIVEFPIFSVLSDGPYTVLATTWVKDGIVQIFERHMVSFDVSNPLGAWHYATVMARIAVFWGTALAERFVKVQDQFVEDAGKDALKLQWTQTHQAIHKSATTAPKASPETTENAITTSGS
ncbi:predicted protein [Postia placenta Mad-698-R]|nr:predicted protein [Postia placenta Mad-698-R]